MMSSSTSRPTFEVNRSLMSSGVVLLCIGFFLWLVGAALSATALGQAAMKWIDQLEGVAKRYGAQASPPVQGSRLGRFKSLERANSLNLSVLNLSEVAGPERPLLDKTCICADIEKLD
jgi:hypothetical protein